jgi:glycosyltransferase involved in cell wall biosynthesis
VGLSRTKRETAGRISVIIPARNEEQDLAPALESVLRQRGVDFEVIVVNDHASDRTGEIADHFARADPRLRVLHAPELPTGWPGKPNAMQQGASIASGEYLIFTDADIHHHPTCFATAVAELKRCQLDTFSRFPLMRFISLLKNVIVPAFQAGLAQFATPGINDPRSPDAIAAGAFFMVSLATFRNVERFGAIRSKILDDVSLARVLNCSGYTIGFRAASRLLQVRMFKGTARPSGE